MSSLIRFVACEARSGVLQPRPGQLLTGVPRFLLQMQQRYHIRTAANPSDQEIARRRAMLTDTERELLDADKKSDRYYHPEVLKWLQEVAYNGD
jgi:hypothetical protein